MSDGPDAVATSRAAVKRVIARLDGFARGLGLERAVARQIAEAVVADLPGVAFGSARVCRHLIRSRVAARQRTPVKLTAVFSSRVATARALLALGTISVADIAQCPGISRDTFCTYFPRVWANAGSKSDV